MCMYLDFYDFWTHFDYLFLRQRIRQRNMQSIKSGVDANTSAANNVIVAN